MSVQEKKISLFIFSREAIISYSEKDLISVKVYFVHTHPQFSSVWMVSNCKCSEAHLSRKFSASEMFSCQ